MPKIGDLPQMQELARFRDQLPPAIPRQKVDPAGDLLGHLLKLLDVCSKNRDRLPMVVRTQTDKTSTALGYYERGKGR